MKQALKKSTAILQQGWRTELIEGRCEAEECEGITVYGLALYCEDECVAAISDISSYRRYVEKLVALCNRNHVTVDSVWDVVEDYLL
ncbi:hypothetical protein EDD70_1120 [Hydrogenoanaerobacterium saccharovorans]|uniref:Uncharacterized protein n=1 Tax=Hydrogenoanaerobacterium saccharovorans TaxID=474960 RepID=A0A1H7ZY92_9FIRM|nr:DUF6514 family protein [Hydrogenoanaerobacterium saccharovorans]RPF48305.1 hypothetical protein EDD70_1120 [Hydrogenoanaerobacterium saccharovorans]SEM63206.1 hypothetical protein SAMN05216180_0971 [Hydrogenoanaerobacterium saccharovorans]